jgi:hypothetical protein
MATAFGLHAAAVHLSQASGRRAMELLRISRWVAGLALVGLAVTTAVADEGTVTITGVLHMDELQGTVGDDLAEVFANAGENTWTLTLYGVTYEHVSTDYTFGGITVSNRMTDAYATSFDLEFSGPDADTLNQVVAGGLSGGNLWLQLRNAYQSSGGDFATLGLWLWPAGGHGTGISFWAGHEGDVSETLFPSDANGYPIVTSAPFSFVCEETFIIDDRSGTSGALVSWYETVAIAGDLGSPIPTTLSIFDVSVTEGDRGTRNVAVPVRLSNTSDQTVTVNYRTVDGSAVASGGKRNADYGAASGTLTFQPGETSKTITISIKSDRRAEPNETFTVQLYGAVGATIEDGVATVTIVNDD